MSNQIIIQCRGAIALKEVYDGDVEAVMAQLQLSEQCGQAWKTLYQKTSHAVKVPFLILFFVAIASHRSCRCRRDSPRSARYSNSYVTVVSVSFLIKRIQALSPLRLLQGSYFTQYIQTASSPFLFVLKGVHGQALGSRQIEHFCANGRVCTTVPRSACGVRGTNAVLPKASRADKGQACAASRFRRYCISSLRIHAANPRSSKLINVGKSVSSETFRQKLMKIAVLWPKIMVYLGYRLPKYK